MKESLYNGILYITNIHIYSLKYQQKHEWNYLIDVLPSLNFKIISNWKKLLFVYNSMYMKKHSIISLSGTRKKFVKKSFILIGPQFKYRRTSCGVWQKTVSQSTVSSRFKKAPQISKWPFRISDQKNAPSTIFFENEVRNWRSENNEPFVKFVLKF